jgi:hypothetical protein
LRYAGICIGKHQEFDHIESVTAQGIRRSDAQTIDQLQCACRPCHKKKTQQQAMLAKGIAPQHIEKDLRLGRVDLPTGFRYAPRP